MFINVFDTRNWPSSRKLMTLDGRKIYFIIRVSIGWLLKVPPKDERQLHNGKGERELGVKTRKN